MHVDREREGVHFTRLVGVRIVGSPTALDAVNADDDAIALRLAPDELLMVTPQLGEDDRQRILHADPHAIILADCAFSAAWIEEDRARHLLERLAEWEMPDRSERPAFVQGSVAGVAAKLYFAEGRVLFVVQSPLAHELEERLR